MPSRSHTFPDNEKVTYLLLTAKTEIVFLPRYLYDSNIVKFCSLFSRRNSNPRMPNNYAVWISIEPSYCWQQTSQVTPRSYSVANMSVTNAVDITVICYRPQRGGGHAWQGEVCMVGGMGGVHSRRGGHCSGRYASYWNAFFLYYLITYEFLVVERFVGQLHVQGMCPLVFYAPSCSANKLWRLEEPSPLDLPAL